MAVNAHEMIIAGGKLFQGKISLTECISEVDKCEQAMKSWGYLVPSLSKPSPMASLENKQDFRKYLWHYS